ncbi:MAG: leucine-rich repeat domain-containing protein [Bacteroidales bacterium]|nr:leucine-rich repeat domain-containing protein [Bacteroidales bacterium]MCI1733943.1 leucine-rich repeat domain-containing protein [Bacteroidales bacterium]
MKLRNILSAIVIVCAASLNCLGQDTDAPKYKIGELYYNFNKGNAMVVKGCGEMDTLRTDYVFSSCVIPASVTYNGHTYRVTGIGNGAFEGCENLKSVTLPATIINIGEEAFSESGIVSIVLPNSVKRIGEFCFQDCKSLKTVTLSNSMSYITKQAFMDCEKLMSITIPSSIKSIEYLSLSGTGLRSINLPNTLQLIGNESLEGSNITSLNIPKSVREIGDYALNYCISLKSLYVHWDKPIKVEDSANTVFPERRDCILYVPKGRRGLYLKAPFWKNFKQIREH